MFEAHVVGMSLVEILSLIAQTVFERGPFFEVDVGCGGGCVM